MRNAKMKMMFPATRMNRSFGDLASDMNSIVDSLFGAATGQSTELASGFTPRMDIHEADDRFVITLDLPGVKADDVQIDIDADNLVVHGTRQSDFETRDDRYSRVERWFGEFRRSVRLPRSVDREQISADYNDGVLCISLPKSKAAAARKIQIRTGESVTASSRKSDVSESTETGAASAESAT